MQMFVLQTTKEVHAKGHFKRRGEEISEQTNALLLLQYD